jgi:hypothetical protein
MSEVSAFDGVVERGYGKSERNRIIPVIFRPPDLLI